MIGKFQLKFIATIILTAMIIGGSSFAFAATQKDLNNAKAKQQQAQALADQKAKEAAQVKQQINVISGQINESQAALNQTISQIEETQKNIDQLSAEISQKQQDLANQKDKLSKVIANWYMQGDYGVLETMIGANNLSDFLSIQKYYNSIKQQITSTMNQIKETRAQLDAQKTDQEKKRADLVGLQNQQTAYRNSIQGQKNQQTSILNMTEAQKKQYLDQVSKLQNEVAHISAELYAQRQKSHWDESIIYGSSSYPFTGIDDLDPWGFATRECTSYAAWYWNVKLGKHWENTRPGSGSAWNWPALAGDPKNGYSVSSTPRVGAIISWQAGPLTSGWGHVAIVEAVNGNGTIDLSEYNWSKYSYTYRKNVNPANYGGYSYIY